VTKSDLNIGIVDRPDRGLTYGEACFETFRVIDGAVFGWQQHVSRLACGLKNFAITLSGTDFEAIREKLLCQAGKISRDTLVRVTVTGGRTTWGLEREDAIPEVYIQCMPASLQYQAAALSVVEWPFPLLPKQAKFTGDYALTLRALQQWKGNGLPGKTEPLICKNGQALAAMTANVLICRNGLWFTPDESNGGVLAGVVRNALVENGCVEPVVCPAAWLEDCEAIALTNSGFFIRRVATVNGRMLDSGDQRFGPLYQALRGEAGVPEL